MPQIPPRCQSTIRFVHPAHYLFAPSMLTLIHHRSSGACMTTLQRSYYSVQAVPASSLMQGAIDNNRLTCLAKVVPPTPVCEE